MIPRAPGLRPLLAAEVVSTSGACMTAIALPWLVLTTTGSAAKAGLVAAVEWDGAREIAHDLVLRPLTLAYAGIDLAMQGVFLAVPVLVFTAYDRNAELAGLLLAAWGAGALAGALPALRLSSREPVGLIRWALVAQAAPLWIVAAPLPPLVLAAGMALSGLANPVANAPASTLVTLSVAEPLRAKTMLAFITASTTAAGAGLFLAGPAAEAFGPRAVLTGGAAIVSLGALGFALATRPRRSDIVARAITSRS